MTDPRLIPLKIRMADSNVNCYYGCSNNCRYCYAQFMAFRFKRIESYEDWETMKPNQKAIDKGYRKRKGRVMFPTSHDITSDPKVRENCFKVLETLLKSGNEVLLTTKPNLTVIQAILFKFKKHKRQIQFRFTITSKEDNILSFFEPGAPTYFERFRALQLSFDEGWKTSVSIEPYLDTYPNLLIEEIAPYCTESIWIGTMFNYNKVVARGIWEIQGIPHDPTVFNEEVDNHRKMTRYIHEINQKHHVKLIVSELNKLPQEIKDKLRLKDSIKNLGLVIK